LYVDHSNLHLGTGTDIQTDQVASAIEAFIWPKVFWDFISRNLDAAVAPIPVLQILNLMMGLVGLAWEWPLKPLAGSIPHRSIEIRLIVYPLSALLAALLYQGTDPAIYYLIGIGVYFWAYSEGEVCCSAYSDTVCYILTRDCIGCLSGTLDLAETAWTTESITNRFGLRWM
jgi:hypothetical protein